MKKQLLFRRFPAVLLALLTVLMLALLPACGGMTTRPMGLSDYDILRFNPREKDTQRYPFYL